MQITPSMAHQMALTRADEKVRVIITAPDSGIFKADLKDKYQAEVTSNLRLIGGVAARMAPAQVEKLLADKPKGVGVYLDQKQSLPAIPEAASDDHPVQPKLHVAIPTLGVDQLWQKGYDGKGVCIAVIDTGIYPHQDFEGRILGFKDCINGRSEPYDDHGHGTHVSSDAAGSGKASDGKFKGTAPQANLVGVKVLDGDGSGYDSGIIEGLQWVVDNKETYNIRVLNMSLGGTAMSSYKDDPLAMALQAAVKEGIVACIAAGNEGPSKETVGTPGNAPSVITVGALNDKRTVTHDDDDIASFSSRGPTPVDALRKPDVLSPGVKITAANAPGSALDRNPRIPHVGKEYITISGTSMATPILAGVVADLVCANPGMSPQDVKRILKTTADRMDHLDRDTQGYGLINPSKALDRALASKESKA